MNNKGFFELPKETRTYTSDSTQDVCYHPEHNPPSHLHIPNGWGYRHECPRCGKVTIVTSPEWTSKG